MSVRFEGRLKSWNDDRGFGFIEPLKGGDEIFVHVKAFPPRSGRPQPEQLLSFEVELGPQGKKRAKNVQAVRAARPVPIPRRSSPAQWGTASYFAIPAFVAVYFIATVAWSVPRTAALVYFGASFVCFVAYAVDKSAASRNAWRISESTLLLLGFFGGWPGAIVAQQVLRHKSSKASFRSAFWGSVVMNVIGFFVFAAWYFASRDRLVI